MNCSDIYERVPDKELRAEFLSMIYSRFPKCEYFSIGKSMLAEDIYCYKVGKGKRHILLVGAHHAAEYITASLLYDFIVFVSEKAARGASYADVNISFLLQKFTFWVIPCLNPDGVELNLHGPGSSPLLARQIRMNGNDNDFSLWQANARGVDLNHNYAYRFFEYKRDVEKEENIEPGRTKYSGEYPESEPESAALASFVRALMPSLAVSLHTQGEEIYSMPKCARVRRIANTAARLIGYKHTETAGSAQYSGFCDYTGAVLGIPSLTVELGKGENPLPFSSLRSLLFKTRRLLIALPTLL